MSYKKLDPIPRWYVIHTQPRQEDRAESNLITWNVETFNPKLKTQRHNQFTGLPTSIAKPLFPRYIFARFSAERLLGKVCFTRGVHTVVSFGEHIVAVEDEVIAYLKSRRGADGFVELDEDFKESQKVTIKGGAFRSLTGVFEKKIKNTDRVIILLEAVSYQCRVVVEKNLVTKSDELSHYS